MLRSSRRALFITPIWLACLYWMWSWWLQSSRINFAPLYYPLTVALIYEFALLPTIFIYFLLKAKYPPKRVAPKGKKVAVITLCVPAKESIDIIERQIKAMSEIEYPHDSWILDEGNSMKVKRLAKKYGVKHFSRKGLAKYNQDFPPFKAKTKAGNVNAWLDFVKRRKYEFFVQFDIDHIPSPNYLHKTLGYFRSPNIAWVQAPSVYSNGKYWTARGSSEQELVLQGPLQMGFYGHSDTPFIIGSHCTYRTSAIREIGGFQPTRAEDHLDTVMLSSEKYKGVFLPEIIAEGDGPESLEVYLAQQFAWAYSMFQVLIHHTPKLIRKLNWRQRFQFMFSQTWYPLWSLSYLVTFLVPIVALIFDREVAKMQGLDFVKHFIPLFACSFLVWWAGRPLMQPKKLRLSWRGMLLHVVRWPIVLKAVFSAIFRIKKPYMITPKGDKHTADVPSVKVYRIFLLLGCLSALAVVFATARYKGRALESQIFFALINAFFMLTICMLDLNIRLRTAAQKITNFSKYWLKPVAAVAMLAVLVSGALVSSPLVTNRVVSALSVPTKATKSLSISEQPLPRLISEIAAVDPPTGPEPTIGIYSETKKIPRNQPYIRHVFVDWRSPHYLAEQLLMAEQEKDRFLVTIEPKGENDGNKLLQDIASGTFDRRLKTLIEILSASKQPVYVRFAHEMDLANLYAWGNKDPENYKVAYRHFVDYARSFGANNIKWVWSPAGNRGAERYYPGDEYVDVIGTTVLYDSYWYGDSQPTFEDIADQRYWLRLFNKPIWIVEYGAGAANRELQTDLIHQALNNYQADGFSALVYLDMKDANILDGPNYSLADLSAFGSLFAARTPKIIASTQNNSLKNKYTNTKKILYPRVELPKILNFYSPNKKLINIEVLSY